MSVQALPGATKCHWETRLLRLAWRIDKAAERCEGTDRVFGLIDEAADVLEEAGHRGAADWLRDITADESEGGITNGRAGITSRTVA